MYYADHVFELVYPSFRGKWRSIPSSMHKVVQFTTSKTIRKVLGSDLVMKHNKRKRKTIKTRDRLLPTSSGVLVPLERIRQLRHLE